MGSVCWFQLYTIAWRLTVEMTSQTSGSSNIHVDDSKLLICVGPSILWRWRRFPYSFLATLTWASPKQVFLHVSQVFSGQLCTMCEMPVTGGYAAWTTDAPSGQEMSTASKLAMLYPIDTVGYLLYIDINYLYVLGDNNTYLLMCERLHINICKLSHFCYV